MTDAPMDILHILSEHVKWLSGDGGARACLTGANLAGANLADAYLAGANLADAYLAGANLARADLADAYLADANLAGACLTDAYLAGANLDGAQCLIDGGQRLDGYRFVGWIKNNAVMIRAGCRSLTLAQYREHNAKRDNAALRDETTAILDHIERVATIRGLIK